MRFLNFFWKYVVESVIGVVGLIVAIGSSLISAYKIIQLGLPVEVYQAVGLFIFASAVIAVVFKQSEAQTKRATEPQNLAIVQADGAIKTPSEVYVRDIALAAIFRSGHTLLVEGVTARYLDRVRVILELRPFAWQTFRDVERIELPPIEDTLKGERFSFPIASIAPASPFNNEEGFAWGAPEARSRILYGPTLGRITFVGKNGQEQRPYSFLLFQGKKILEFQGDGSGEHPVPYSLLQGGNLDIVGQWLRS